MVCEIITECRKLLESIWNNNVYKMTEAFFTTELSSELGLFEAKKSCNTGLVLNLTLFKDDSKKYMVTYNDYIQEGIVFIEDSVALDLEKYDIHFFEKYADILLAHLNAYSNYIFIS